MLQPAEMAAMEAGDVQMAGRAAGKDRAFQEWFWIAERCVWAVLALFVVAGMAGLTGSGGPFARGMAEAGGARIDYPATARWQTAETLTITLPAAAADAAVTLPASLLETFNVTEISPRPMSVTVSAQGERYRFTRAADGGPVTLRFDMIARAPQFPAAPHRIEAGGAAGTVRIAVLP